MGRRLSSHERLIDTGQPGDFQFQDIGYTPTDDPHKAIREDTTRNSTGYARLAFNCPKTGKPCADGAGIIIGFPNKPPFNRSWQWNGDVQQPTLKPSINYDGGCGWHGYLADGQFVL